MKQPYVSRSSYESKYRSLANVVTDIVLVTHLLNYLYVSLRTCPLLLELVLFCYANNKGGLFISENHISHNYHFTRELIMSFKLGSHTPNLIYLT